VKIMNGNLIIKTAAELVTCSGFAAKRDTWFLIKKQGGSSIVKQS
jgi:hypothetical protein